MSDNSALHLPRSPVSIAPVSIDELSTVRYIHAQSLRSAAAGWASDDELALYAAHIYSPDYAEAIEHAIAASRLGGGYVADQLVATCGWTPVDEDTVVARIRWCHVQPMFGGLGIGSALLAHIEAQAEDAGHTTLVARSSPDAAGFFERAGYGVTAHGTRAVGNGRSFPLVYLRKNLGPTEVPALF